MAQAYRVEWGVKIREKRDLRLCFIQCIINTKTDTKKCIYKKGVPGMYAIKATTLRQNFKDTCDRVYNGETLIVTRPNDQNIIMLSESQYEELQKAQRNLEYITMIDRRFEALERGEGKQHDLIED